MAWSPKHLAKNPGLATLLDLVGPESRRGSPPERAAPSTLGLIVALSPFVPNECSDAFVISMEEDMRHLYRGTACSSDDPGHSHVSMCAIP